MTDGYQDALAAKSDFLAGLESYFENNKPFSQNLGCAGSRSQQQPFASSTLPAQAPLDHAAEFLQALGGGAFHFRTFDDDQKRSRKELVRTLYGTLEQHGNSLRRLNERGAGVFVVVNEGGNSDSQITRIRALFIDFDQPDENRRFDFALDPSLVVESSPGKHHVYWLVDNFPVKFFRKVQGRLIDGFGTDPQVKNESRVMRLPGFFHRKGEPYHTRIMHNTGRRYDFATDKEWLRNLLKDMTPSKLPAGLPAPAKMPGADTYAEKAFRNAIDAVTTALEGNRNNELNKQAHGLYVLAKAGRLDEQEVTSQLERAAGAAGLSLAEISTTLKSARRAAVPRMGETRQADVGVTPLPELPVVAPFHYDLLPNKFRGWVADIAERMQCPPDFVAVGAMVTLAAVVGRKCGIRPKQKDNWTETPNLWGMVIGRPGILKSPALESAFAPLTRLIAQAKTEYDQALSEYQQNAAVAKLKKAAAETKAKDTLKKNPQADISGLHVAEPDPPAERRYKSNDPTPACLGELLRLNPNGLLVYRDEIVSLLKSLDKDENAEGRGFYLTGWNGDSPYTIDRIGRGMNLHVPAVCLSLLGGTQPGKVAEYVRHAVKGGSGDDGLIQRFGLTVWPDISSDWKDIDRWPDTEAKNQAFEVFDRLDKLDPLKAGAQQDTAFAGDPEGLPCFRFADDAQEFFQQWRAKLEHRLRSGDLHPAIESHLAKYRKHIPALALLIHLADNGGGPVTLQATMQAVAWGDYLESHANRLYGSVVQPEVQAAKAILKKISKGELRPIFTARDIHRKGWAMLADREAIHAGLNTLVDHGYLCEETIETGGRPSISYIIRVAQ